MSQGRKDHLRFLSSDLFFEIKHSDTEKCWWVLEQWKGMSQVSQDRLRFLSPVHCGGNLKNASWQFDGVMSTNLDPIWTISLKRNVDGVDVNFEPTTWNWFCYAINFELDSENLTFSFLTSSNVCFQIMEVDWLKVDAIEEPWDGSKYMHDEPKGKWYLYIAFRQVKKKETSWTFWRKSYSEILQGPKKQLKTKKETKHTKKWKWIIKRHHNEERDDSCICQTWHWIILAQEDGRSLKASSIS